MVLDAVRGEPAAHGEGKEAAGRRPMGINRAAVRPQERTAALRRPVSIDEDQGQIGIRFNLLPGVTLPQFRGSDPQTLFQTQEVIRAQDDGGGAATLVEAGQIGMAMEPEAAVQRQAFLVHLLVERHRFRSIWSH